MSSFRARRRLTASVAVLLLAGASLRAQAPAATELRPNLVDNIARPLRYRPDGEAFVITNGGEFFNRPLYGGNTAFRVDAGDQPEFALYLPGRGGNLRLGLRTSAGAKWLHEAATIESRYLPGEMRYEIRDPLLGRAGLLKVTAVALAEREGLAVRVELASAEGPVELLAAYGGVNGQRGRRDGDIGTEAVPIGEWFQLKPEACRDNVITVAGESFTLRSPAAEILGRWPAGSQLVVTSAEVWNSPEGAFKPPPEFSVLFSSTPLTVGQAVFLGLERRDAGKASELDTYREVSAAPDAVATAPQERPAPVSDWARAFASAEEHFAALRHRVRVETPDPYLNAAVGALNVAADAVWDEPQQGIMHGAVAWRTKLLGWRGPYALDALGWPERARANFTYWLGRQNTTPAPEKLPPADAASNLARSEAGLHSNGDLSNSHYDMNLVFIDALFRHLLWTGDKDFARQAWPAIERHLAWERRLFRREFTAGDKKLPLYEAYAAIWASDDLQYSGGGTAHASAYNYWHNRMAARIAPLVGTDPAPYAHEADLIARGMRELLWTDDHFAESKDLLGRQLVHPAIGLWSFYHVLDSELATAQEADRMTHYVDDNLPHLPVSVQDYSEGWHVLATSNWMPYTWSLNNVVMGENAHTALGYWQAGRRDEAWQIAKGALVASMYLGICPGNVGSMNCLDVYRRESQRDFADGTGILSRALVEGLFGVRPDALAGELRIAPGLPTLWEHASLHHPNVDFSYSREGGLYDRYLIKSRFARPMTLRLEVPVVGLAPRITINGRKADGKLIPGPAPRLQIEAPSAENCEVRIAWTETADSRIPGPYCLPEPPPESAPLDQKPGTGTVRPVDLNLFFNDRVTEIFRPGKYVSPRSPFVSLAAPAQGIGYWAGHVNATAEIDDTGLRSVAAAHGGRVLLPNGVAFATPGPGEGRNVLFTSQWDNYPREATVPLSGKARRLHLLMAGSTNAMQSRLDNGEVLVTFTDGEVYRLPLRNPETWWPIEQDYFIDDFQFPYIAGKNYPSMVGASLPVRVDLKTGLVRVLDAATFKGKGRAVPGGAATVLVMELAPEKELQSLTVRALANDVVIGLMAATLEQ